MPRVVWTRPALDDVRQIRDHLAEVRVISARPMSRREREVYRNAEAQEGGEARSDGE